MTSDNLEIQKVANGYFVRPPHDYSRGPTVKAYDNMHVFETFDAMVAFLRDNFEGIKGVKRVEDDPTEADVPIF